jgi:anti-sigma factor RsiW
MHQPVKDNLEEYLRHVGGMFPKPLPPAMEAHLESCGECAEKLNQLQQQAVALRSLQAPPDLEPRAGFYARVRQRIEEARATRSVWSAFLEPVFAKRLIFASATLVVLLGTYLFTTEPVDMTPGSQPTTIVATPRQVAATPDDPDVSTSPQERDAVLVNLAAYHE